MDENLKVYAIVIMGVVGAFLLALTSNLIPSSILTLPTESIAPTLSGSLGASMVSSNPNPPAILSILGQDNLTSGAVYKWTLTVTNPSTATATWTSAHVTIRIVGLVGAAASSGITPYEVLDSSTASNFAGLFGPGTFGKGVVQVCYNPSTQQAVLNATYCLVNLNGGKPTTPLGEAWNFTSTSQLYFSPDRTIAVIPVPGQVAPGQSVTFSFTASIPPLNGSQFGQYYALENLVAFSTGVNSPDLLDYNIVPLNLTSGTAGVFNTTNIEAIAGASLLGLSIFAGVLDYFKRRK